MTIHHIGDFGLHITRRAMFHTAYVTISLQNDFIIRHGDNTVYDIPAIIYPCQYHVTDTQIRRTFQFHTFLTADDEGPHADTINREDNLTSFPYQPYRLFQDGNVFILQNHYGFQSKRCKIKHII